MRVVVSVFQGSGIAQQVKTVSRSSSRRAFRLAPLSSFPPPCTRSTVSSGKALALKLELLAEPLRAACLAVALYPTFKVRCRWGGGLPRVGHGSAPLTVPILPWVYLYVKMGIPMAKMWRVLGIPSFSVTFWAI